MPVITNLVAYWSLEEASGSRADATGRGNTLTDNNTVTSGTGKVGTAAQFTSANSESLSRASNTDTQMGNGHPTSLACWFKTSDSGLIIMGSKWSNAAGDEYLLYLTGGNVRFRQYDAAGNSREALTTASTYADGAWHFVAGTYNDVNQVPSISVDDGAVTSDSANVGSALNGSNIFAIGGSGSGSFWFNGLIDEFAIWQKILTPTEITWLYNAGSGRSYADIVAESGSGGKPALYYAQHMGA